MLGFEPCIKRFIVPLLDFISCAHVHDDVIKQCSRLSEAIFLFILVRLLMNYNC